MPALPYSKKRYYLSGIDWIIGVLNNYMCSKTAAGNHSTLVIELEKPIKKEILRSRIDSIYNNLPLLSGRLARDLLNLAPYWKVPSGKLKNYNLNILNLKKADNIEDEFIKVLNTSFSSKQTYLSFILMKSQMKNFLLMTFDHRILDARGAELFLNLLVECSDNELCSSISKIKTTDSPQLKDWREKFRSGRTVQREIITFSKEGCFSNSRYNMKDLPATKNINLIPSFHHFSDAESREISNEAEKKAGFMMETPYLLAMTAKAFYEVTNPEKPVKYFVPVPIDMRAKGEESEKTLFNHLSFLFFHFEITNKTTTDELICEIRNQFFKQIEEEFPEEMIKAAYPGRIFPYWFLKRAMRLPFDGKNCTFVFSNVGQLSFNYDNILGSKIKNIHHMPRIPTPPGIGIFFNRFNDSFNMSIISDKNAIEDSFAEKLKEKIISLIL